MITPAPMVVVVGETASGKSALALALAEQFDGELICADSWTVYKGFDIGTAKPTVDEQVRVRHHLLDIADPAVGFSAAEFQKQARATIDDISWRGKLPIMVGGTGLYIDSVLYGYQFLPAPPVGLRQKLDALPLDELVRQATAAGYGLEGIDLRNKRRVIRLIENGGLRPTKQGLRPNTLILGTYVKNEQLHQRVAQRIEAMFAAGLEHEVRRLSSRYGWDAEPMKGIGYREWQPYFSGRPDREQTRQRIISATMGLAKRQRTWFNQPERAARIHWLRPPNTYIQAVELVTTFISN